MDKRERAKKAEDRKRRVCYRYFANLVRPQERWLNRMAAEGWRLTGTGKLKYEFEPCAPGSYEYRAEFVGQLSSHKSREYRTFLEEMGYDVFYKNVNLNWSVGKVAWRPYGQGAGQIATSPGSYNKEIMLVGRQAGDGPFELHSTWEDKAGYAGTLGRAWLSAAVILLMAAAGLAMSAGQVTLAGGVLGGLGVCFLVQAGLYQREAESCCEEARIEEQEGRR